MKRVVERRLDVLQILARGVRVRPGLGDVARRVAPGLLDGPLHRSNRARHGRVGLLLRGVALGERVGRRGASPLELDAVDARVGGQRVQPRPERRDLVLEGPVRHF